MDDHESVQTDTEHQYSTKRYWTERYEYHEDKASADEKTVADPSTRPRKKLKVEERQHYENATNEW